eukprot:6462720-Amphidinium_carterae.1
MGWLASKLCKCAVASCREAPVCSDDDSKMDGAMLSWLLSLGPTPPLLHHVAAVLNCQLHCLERKSAPLNPERTEQHRMEHSRSLCAPGLLSPSHL